jgi:hypothetical protein
MTLPWKREMDRVDGVAGPRPVLRLDTMTGDWINTNSESLGIRRVRVMARGGGLTVRPVSAGEPAPGDWGEAAAGSIFADGMRSDHGMAWIARFRAASGWESHLQANVNLGLLVLAAFHAAPFSERSERSERSEGSDRPERSERPEGSEPPGRSAGSERAERSEAPRRPGRSAGSSYFAREFYRRADGAVSADHGPGSDAGSVPPFGGGEGGEGGEGGGGGEGGAVDPGPLLGIWHNTNPTARGIARIDLRGLRDLRELRDPRDLRELPRLRELPERQPEPLGHAGAAFTCQVLGVGAPASGGSSGPPIDWGPVPATPFAHDSRDGEAMAFSAAYDFGFQQVELQANVKQGVLVVATFNHFAASDPRSSYFTREFFYR